MSEIDNTAVSKVLGQVVDYPDQYDPTILVRELRQNNRDHLDIDGNNLPFCGFDTWNAYEVSTLTSDGKPVCGVLKIVYPCNSPYIVESKSLKLYLNSFNMFRWESCWADEVVADLVTAIKRDLTFLLETEVDVHFFDSREREYNATGTRIFPRIYTNVDEYIYGGDSFTEYNETPSLLRKETLNRSTMHYRSAMLKSNCRVTRQPDWGDAFVYMSASKVPSPRAFAEYIVSFRDECHFHEEICETIFIRLLRYFNPTELVVTCLYARRGGIDINPTRALDPHMLPDALGKVNFVHNKTMKQ